MRSINTTILVLAAGLLAAAMWGRPLHAQQHSYTTQEIDQGRMLYDSNCGRCHGDNGAGVTGVELFKQIRRATSDEDIAKIIQNGIPGTGMPPHQFSDVQALSVVAFLRTASGAAATPAATVGGGTVTSPLLAGGDAERGKALFEGKGECLTCHAVNGKGSRNGPELTAIGRPRGRGFGLPQPNIPQLQRAILDPNADIAEPYRLYQVVLKNGEIVQGKVMNQDTFSVQLLDMTQHLRSFAKADLRSFGFLPSPMPSYRGKLTDQEVKDILSYLVSLKG
jgi:putative heme-binding domain-containing protein